MIIRQARIEEFGLYQAQGVGPLEPGLVLFLGDNESGKSTFVGFVRAMLFGFPKQSEKARSYPLPAAGRAVGHLVLETRGGARYQVTRKVSRKAAGDVAVSPLDDAPPLGLQDLLGNVTRDVFRNVFAFSLDELRDFRALDADQVRAVLYGASAGTAIQALPDAQRFLDERARKLLSVDPKPIEVNLARLAAKREELRAALGRVGEYDRACEELRRVVSAMDACQVQLAEVQSCLAWVDATRRMWEPWERRQRLLDTLRSLPPGLGEFPVDGLARLDQVRLLCREKRARVASLEAELMARESGMAEAVVDGVILGQAVAIASLRDERGQFVEARRALAALALQEEKVGADLGEALAALGEPWDAERVRASAALRVAEDDILEHQGRLREAQVAAQAATQALSEKQDVLARQVEAERASWAILEAMGPDEPAPPPEATSALQSGRDRFRAESVELEELRRTLAEEGRAIDEELRGVAGSWERRQLEALDAASVRAALDGMARRSAEKEKECLQAAAAAEAVERLLAEAEAACDQAQSGLAADSEADGVGRSVLEGRQQALSAVRSLVRERDHAEGVLQELSPQCEARRRDLEAVERQLSAQGTSMPARVGVMLVLAGLVAAGVLLALGHGGLAALVGGVLAIMGGLLAVTSAHQRQAAVEQVQAQRARLDEELAILELRRKKAGSALEGVEARFQEAAAQAGLTPPCTAEAVEQHDATLRDQLTRAQARSMKEEDLERRRGLRASRERDVAERRERLAQREAEKHRLLAGVAEVLRPLGLPGEWSPAEALAALARLEVLQQRVRQMGAGEARVQALEGSTAAWRALALEAGARADEAETLLGEVDALLAREREAMGGVAERRAAWEVHAERAVQLQAAQGAVEEAARRELEMGTARLGVETAWKGWLETHGLSTDLAPPEALALVQGVKRVLALLEQQDAQAVERRRHEDFVGEYEGRVRTVSGIVHREAVEGEDVPGEVEALVRLLEMQQQAQVRSEQMGNVAEQLHASLVRAKEELAEAEHAVRACCESAGCSDEEAYAERAALAEQWRRLVHEETGLGELLRFLGGEDKAEVLASRFEGRTPEDLEEECRSLESEEARLRHELEGHGSGESRTGGWRDRKAELEHRLQQLGSSEEVGRLRAEEEMLKARLHELGLEWSRYKVARFLVDEAWRRFERKARPGVISDAAGFFETITQGAYGDISLPRSDEKGDFEVVTRTGARRTIGQLSSGTQEQLYLSLRFGFLRHQAQVTDPLPVIMDDILVNCDPARSRRAAEAILQLASAVQVLFFTCHPQTVEHFRAVQPRLRVVDLQDGQFSTQEVGTWD